MRREFIPKSYFYLRSGYGFSVFKKDLLAGLTVGIIALPLAMAFAIASGVEPARGLYTAIIAGFLVSLLGGSRIQIGGPTGAFVVIVYGIIQRTGYNGLCLSMLVAAALLILAGIFRLGSWIKYVPHPLITGFTSGIAVVILSTQVKDFFGLKMGTPPADFTEKWISYFDAFPTFDPLTLSMAAGTLGLILLIRRFFPSLPWGISAILLATTVCSLFSLDLDTIHSRFGEIPKSLPFPSLPSFSIPAGQMKEILVDGIILAFLGGIESLLSAVIGDGMIGGRHRSNCELIAHGIANFGSVLFGGIPATGAIARTAANIKTGAQTPVAGMVHAILLLFILYFLSPLVSQIPLAALSAVLVMVSWNMSEVGHFTRLLKAPFEDRLILLTSFFLTVFVDITVAISTGMILASLLFMKKMSQISKALLLSKEVPIGTVVYEIQGPFFFGTANMLRDLSMSSSKVFILRMGGSSMIDASGMHGLEEFYQQCKKKNIALFLSDVQEETRDNLKKFGLLETIGEEQIFPDLDAALVKAGQSVTF